MEPDFSGYATKAGVKCTDGRTITPQAFQHMDKVKVPLVWQHVHDKVENVLGHAILEAREDGVYAHGYFNNTQAGQTAKLMVQHEDITAMSIYANQLMEKMVSGAKSVLHGVIREVSLVMAGANSEAKIEYIRLAHGDGSEPDILEDEAIIYMGFKLEHSEPEEELEEDNEPEDEDEDLEHAEEDSLQDVYNSLDADQKLVVAYLVDQALEAATSAEHSDIPDSEDPEKDAEELLAHQEGPIVNVFEQNEKTQATVGGELRHAMSSDDVRGVVQDAIRHGSLKAAVESYALAHNIDNINLLFPDARTLQDRPEFNKRRTEWVAGVLADTSHSPFSRVKTLVADLTFESARAKGYIKGNMKKEEFFGVSKRVTSPTTVYKKQALDRDDVIDITDFDVIAWLKMEMRIMLEEEVARAILVGDGRDVSDDDKIKDPLGASDGIGIRSILNDDQLYVTTINVNVDDANSSYDEVIDAVMDGMEFYKGTGTPTFYTTLRQVNKFLKAKDGMGRRLYNSYGEVAAALGVSKIVTVEAMNEVAGVIGIVVNLQDYNVGTDQGGEVNMFDDFDIDYNKQKYLIETRLSGALVKVKSALVIRSTAQANVLVVPQDATFVPSTGVVVIPNQTGVVYKNLAGTTLTAGAQTAIASGTSTTIIATPASGYYFSTNDDSVDSWTFKRP
jgi:HK97 family phage prohead protease